ncbi:hypothetical protein KDW92_08375, partial [Burkholderia vietnamiensis]|nr:hypothetical protein [Burkholderia vietnamiensis]
SVHNSSSMIGLAISSVSVVPMPEVNSSPRKLTAPRGLFETVSKRVGLPQFVATLDAMREWSHEQIADAVEEATSRMPPTVSLHDVGDDEMNQGAIYDPESGDWMFADFE